VNAWPGALKGKRAEIISPPFGNSFKGGTIAMAGRNVRVSRGFLVICDECTSYLVKEKWVDDKSYSKSDDIIHELCPNCSDYNKPLIDDLLGSSE
jgi:hypothetical protein